MAVTKKKRRLETEPQTQVAATSTAATAAAAAPAMSAFALRRRLLQKAEVPVVGGDIGIQAAPTGESCGSSGPDDDSTTRPAGQTEPDSRPASATKTSEAIETADEPSGFKPRREAPVQRSTFRPTKQNCRHRADGSMRLKLAEGERLVILGSYGVVVGSGEVTVAGATLRPRRQAYWVHAPQCHALPIVRCTDEATVTLVPHLGAAGLRKLERLAPVFGQLWNETKEAKETFQILYTPQDGTTRSQGLVSPPEWNKLMAELAAAKRTGSRRSGGAGVYFVCGPKGSGKSTFSRLLTNRLLTEEASTGGAVAMLDIDPGQPEFATPGTVSLVRVSEPNLSPPFCHPYVASRGSPGSSGSPGSVQRLRAHDLAAASLASDPEHYIACVMDLYGAYQRDQRDQGGRRCPLVINTPGWVLGTGLDVLAELVRRMRPSRVVYMSQDGPEETMQGLRAAYVDVPLVALPSQPSEYTSRTAQHLRAMQTMSYLHLDLGDKEAKDGLSWDPTPLTAVRPWVVPYASGPESGILGVLCYDYQPGPELLADAINGTVVSIVAVERAAAVWSDDGVESLPVVCSPEGLPCIVNSESTGLDPLHSYAVGVALLRGIDTTTQTLQLLTPVSAAAAVAEVLRQDGLGVVLVSGKQDAPTWAYTEELYRRRADVEAEADGDEVRHGDDEAMPWVEVLHGNEKRAVGSQVWRVRRDLGRNNGD
ncbi:RNA processing protein [Grosmannia clavigera kw1407]|uniref:Polynucleotide 5'-hydroxyl-kinase GRC3 n=1 Tax=Grosmannia clavigera (strain kw1407 / UAMH 11150) TaxID=655863 RepID=F0XNC5_GROCL|nr:RNA processing protein [Grosmannia clavigera kw1407]EFX00884.1 RNA processing protein [Grosmannia clavigera kw1407]